MLSFTFLLLISVAIVSADNLYVSSYSGNITSLSLNTVSGGEYVLSTLSVLNSLTPNPSWLTKIDNHIYVSNENFGASNGTILQLSTTQTGDLSYEKKPLIVPGGPVSMYPYNHRKALAVAH